MRHYYINKETARHTSWEQPDYDTTTSPFWLSKGFEEVSRAEYLAFGKEHAGPRSLLIYLDDEQHTKLREGLKRLQAGKHPGATLPSLVSGIISLYIKERL